MPRFVSAVLLLASLVAPAAAEADEFSDFRIPPHSVTTWDVGLNVQGSRSTLGYPSQLNRERAILSAANTTWYWLHDSEPFTTRLETLIDARDQRRWITRSQGDVAGNYSQTNDRNEDAVERLLLYALHRHHPWANPIGFQLRSLADANYGQSWSRQHTQSFIDFPGTQIWDRSVSAAQSWRASYNVIGDAAIGAGRVRDATGVYEARLLEDRLREAGALTRPLSAEARQRLIDLMTVRFAYDAAHQRPAKDLWREIEQILANDGALSEGGLHPRTVMRAGEPTYGSGVLLDVLPGSPVMRESGAFGGLSFSARHSRFLVRSDTEVFETAIVNGVPQPPIVIEGHSRYDFPVDDYMIGVEGEYHRPIGLRWQTDVGARVLAPVRSEDDGFSVTSGGTVAWLVADRWLAQGSIQQQREIRETNNITMRDDWRWSYGASVTYFLEDRLAIQLAASEQQSDQSSLFGRFGFLSLGVSYRVMGRFRAPQFTGLGS